MRKDNPNPALSKSLFLAELVQQRLLQTAQQVEREIKQASDQDAANACLSIQVTLLRAKQAIADGIQSALEAVA